MMNRRDFLKTAATLAALGVVSKVAGAVKAPAAAAEKSGPVDLVAIRGGEPEEMFDKAIRELGGMEKFVKKGQTVLVKPNIGWDRPVEAAANTNPKLVARIVRRCKEAGAKEVYVFDTTCSRWDLAYKSSGIADAARKEGAIVVGGDSASDKAYLEKYYVDEENPKAKRLKKIQMAPSGQRVRCLHQRSSAQTPRRSRHDLRYEESDGNRFQRYAALFPCQRPQSVHRRYLCLPQTRSDSH